MATKRSKKPASGPATKAATRAAPKAKASGKAAKAPKAEKPAPKAAHRAARQTPDDREGHRRERKVGSIATHHVLRGKDNKILARICIQTEHVLYAPPDAKVWRRVTLGDFASFMERKGDHIENWDGGGLQRLDASATPRAMSGTPRPSPLAEAHDPATPPARLRELLSGGSRAVQRAAARNGNLPHDLLRSGLQRVGWLEYAVNPSLPLLLLLDPGLDAWRALYDVARMTLLPEIAQAQRRHPALRQQAVALLLAELGRLRPSWAADCASLAALVSARQPVPTGGFGPAGLAWTLAASAEALGIAQDTLPQAVDAAVGPRPGPEALAAIVPLCRALVELLPRQQPLTLEALAALEGLARSRP